MLEAMKKRRTLLFLALMAATAVLLSVPYLVPHTGALMLVGFVPLLIMDRLASEEGVKRFWLWHYGTFLLWNSITTFWVCNATVGGGIFAALANALQMSLVFGFYRLMKKRMDGVLPYIFLAAAWIAWEKYYLDLAEITWPWLVLGNGFAGSIRTIQWYEWTGTLGGSLWVWASNLAIFGSMVALSDGRWYRWNVKARAALVTAVTLVILGPVVTSSILWRTYEETDNPVEVLMLQPNIDPYHKFESLTQDEQDDILLELLDKAAEPGILVLAPETFTREVETNNIPASSRTARKLIEACQRNGEMNILFGATTFTTGVPESHTSTTYKGITYEQHNSAIIVDSSARAEIYHKSKLVPGVESSPYPGFSVPLENLLGGNLMGKDIGQEERSVLHYRSGGRDIPIGCAVCYESVYGNFCREYIEKGAQILAVITNDAWWGDTPGYRQHLRYASLRAIETRRDIARCANTGISAIINQRGEVVASTPWWQKATLRGTVNANTAQTFFVKSGDVVGKLSVFVFSLLLLAGFVRKRK